MDEDRSSTINREIRVLQQTIYDLMRKKTELKTKQETGELSREEEIEMIKMPELLEELKSRKNFWQDLVINDNELKAKSKSFSEADRRWIASVTKVDCEYRDWTALTSELDGAIVPSAEFQVSFEYVSKAFHMTSQSGRRIYLNLFLSDIILRPEFENALRIFPQLEKSVESVVGLEIRRLEGIADYTIGCSKGKGIFTLDHPRESHLVAIEAKSGVMSDGDMCQCIAEAAALYKSRKDARKANCAVWGVLSSADRWTFIHIDHEGKLHQSKEYPLELRSYDHDQVKMIYGLLHYVVNCCFKSCTLTSTPASSSVE